MARIRLDDDFEVYLDTDTVPEGLYRLALTKGLRALLKEGTLGIEPTDVSLVYRCTNVLQPI